MTLTLVEPVAVRVQPRGPAGPGGPPGPLGPSGPAGDAQMFETRAIAQASSVTEGVNVIYLASYHSPIYGGAANYRRAESEPSHPGKLQTADGAWWEIMPDPVLNLMQFGAKPDGSDSYQACVDAETTAVAIGRSTLLVPPGTWDNAQRWVIARTGFTLFGLDKETTRIRRRAGATLTNLLHLGVTSGDTWNTNISVKGITFDGNGSCSDSVLKLRNVGYSGIQDIRCTGGIADGFKTDTTTATVNTLQVRNVYNDIESDANASKGICLIGEKDGIFDKLFAYNNTSDGIYFRAFKFSNQLAETTECVIGSLLARDNGGDGVVFDGTEKYVVAGIQTDINSGYGVRFRSTDTGVTSAGQNSVNIASINARHNMLGGIRCADSAQMIDAQFGSIKVIGGATVVGAIGVHLTGVQRSQFGSIIIRNNTGAGMVLDVGTPHGVTTQCNELKFGDILLLANGAVGSSSGNAGLSIAGSANDITIGSLSGSNSFTTGGDFELNIGGSVTRVSIGDLALLAASSGNEHNGITNATVNRYSHRDADPVTMVHTGAAVTVPGHVVLFRDSASGDLKARFPNGTTATVTAD